MFCPVGCWVSVRHAQAQFLEACTRSRSSLVSRRKASALIAVSSLRVSQAYYYAHSLSLRNTFISISKGAVLKKKKASVEFGVASISSSVKTRIFRSHIRFEHPVMAGCRLVNWWAQKILQKTKFLLCFSSSPIIHIKASLHIKILLLTVLWEGKKGSPFFSLKL